MVKPVKSGNDDNGNTPWNRQNYKFDRVEDFQTFFKPFLVANPAIFNSDGLAIPETESLNEHIMVVQIGSEMYVQGVRTSDGEVLTVPLTSDTVEAIRIAVNGNVVLWVEFRMKPNAPVYDDARFAFELISADEPPVPTYYTAEADYVSGDKQVHLEGWIQIGTP